MYVRVAADASCRLYVQDDEQLKPLQGADEGLPEEEQQASFVCSVCGCVGRPTPSSTLNARARPASPSKVSMYVSAGASCCLYVQGDEQQKPAGSSPAFQKAGGCSSNEASCAVAALRSTMSR